LLAQLFRWVPADGHDDRLPRAVAKGKFKGSRSPKLGSPAGGGGGLSHFLEDRVVYFYIH
jgi:hypothetical protein